MFFSWWFYRKLDSSKIQCIISNKTMCRKSSSYISHKIGTTLNVNKEDMYDSNIGNISFKNSLFLFSLFFFLSFTSLTYLDNSLQKTLGETKPERQLHSGEKEKKRWPRRRRVKVPSSLERKGRPAWGFRAWVLSTVYIKDLPSGLVWGVQTQAE